VSRFIHVSRELGELIGTVKVRPMPFWNPALKNNPADPRIAKSRENQPTGPASVEPPSARGGPMKLIPWEDIWTCLRVARIRGDGDMIDVFYDTLFREAVFDDDGAWSLPRKKP
jgi:hypothetical protein